MTAVAAFAITRMAGYVSALSGPGEGAEKRFPKG